LGDYKGVLPFIVFIMDFAVNYKLCTVNYGRSKGTEVILENIVTCLPFVKGEGIKDGRIRRCAANERINGFCILF